MRGVALPAKFDAAADHCLDFAHIITQSGHCFFKLRRPAAGQVISR
jgi:hypothetical protein